MLHWTKQTIYWQLREKVGKCNGNYWNTSNCGDHLTYIIIIYNTNKKAANNIAETMGAYWIFVYFNLLWLTNAGWKKFCKLCGRLEKNYWLYTCHMSLTECTTTKHCKNTLKRYYTANAEYQSCYRIRR